MKIYDCSVLAGGEAVVTNELGIKIPVTDAILNALGEKPSSGKLLISEEFAVYIVNTQPDLKETISQLAELCGKLSTLCETSIGGGTATIDKPYLLLKPEFEAIKSQLEAFKLI